jgi:MFS family permease
MNSEIHTDKPVAARWATFALFFANGFGFGAWAAAIPPLRAALSLSTIRLSYALLAISLGAVVVMQFAGRLMSVLGGSGRATHVSCVVFAVALALTTLSPNLFSLVVVALLMGVGNGLMDVSMNAHAAFLEKKWGAAIMSSFHAGFSLGGLAGAGTGAALIAVGLPTRFLMVPVAVAMLVLLYIVSGKVGVGNVEAPPRSGFRMPEKRILAFVLIGMCSYVVEGAMSDWSGLYLVSIGAAPAVAAAGFSAFSITMVTGRMTGDFVVRKIGGVRTLLFGTLLAGCGLTAAVAFPSIPSAVVGFAMVGAGLANVVPVCFGWCARLGSSAAGGLAMAATAGYGGLLAGPPIIGSISAAWSLRVGVGVLAFLALTAFCAALFARRIERRVLRS